MASDNFLIFPTPASGTRYGKIQPIGESQDRTHIGAIEIQAFAFGVETPVTISSASGGAGAGKAKFNELDITKGVDSASTALFEAATQGVYFPQVLLKIRRSGASDTTQPDYLIYDFRMVFVSKVAWTGGGGVDAPEEVVTLVYGALGVSYAQRNANGSLGTPKTATWSQITNSPRLP